MDGLAMDGLAEVAGVPDDAHAMIPKIMAVPATTFLTKI